MKRTIKMIMFMALPMFAFACNGGEKSATGNEAAPASIVSDHQNKNDECLTVLRHINREDMVQYEVANPEMRIEGIDKFYAHVSCELIWPKTIMGQSSDKLQKALLDQIIGEPDKFKSLDDALNHEFNAENYILFEKNDIKNVKHIKRIPEETGMNQAYYHVQLTPMKMDKNLCVFQFSKDDYMGGAHGLFWNEYVTYDVIKDKVIQLTDLVTDTLKLRQVISKALYEMEGVNNMKQLTEDKGFFIDTPTAPLARQFYVDGFNIHFVYAPYEIASYARGEVDVEVEYYRLDQENITTDYLNELVERYTR